MAIVNNATINIGVPVRLAFADKDAWNAYAPELTELLSSAERGNDRIIVFIKSARQMKDLTGGRKISAAPELLDGFNRICGEENVAVRASKQTRDN